MCNDCKIQWTPVACIAIAAATAITGFALWHDYATHAIEIRDTKTFDRAMYDARHAPKSEVK